MLARLTATIFCRQWKRNWIVRLRWPRWTWTGSLCGIKWIGCLNFGAPGNPWAWSRRACRAPTCTLPTLHTRPTTTTLRISQMLEIMSWLVQVQTTRQQYMLISTTAWTRVSKCVYGSKLALTGSNPLLPTRFKINWSIFTQTLT